jgi:hypothetical protein
MSDLLQIVSRLEQAGGKLSLDGDRITYTIPKGSQEAHEILSQLREHRERVAELLRNREATCAASCYEIELGRRIHRPWDGCHTPTPSQPEGRKSEAVCWHCGGERRCACSTCALEERGRPAGPCAACHGTGRVWTWIQ